MQCLLCCHLANDMHTCFNCTSRHALCAFTRHLQLSHVHSTHCLASCEHLDASTVCTDIAASISCVIECVCAYSGKLVSRMCVSSSQTCPCIFEYIYLSRPDSVLNDMSVYNFQLGLGSRLSERIRYASYTLLHRNHASCTSSSLQSCIQVCRKFCTLQSVIASAVICAVI